MPHGSVVAGLTNLRAFRRVKLMIRATIFNRARRVLDTPTNTRQALKMTIASLAAFATAVASAGEFVSHRSLLLRV
jgi:hypothetical protein